METTTQKKTLDMLPKLDCGACGYKTCIDFANKVDNGDEDLKLCIHIADKVDTRLIQKNALYVQKKVQAWVISSDGKII